MNQLPILFFFAVNWLFSVQGLDDVRLPPTILTGPPSSVIYRVEETIELPCLANGIPQPTYEWRINEKSLNLNAHHIRRLNDGNIKISNAGTIDEGYYQCVVSNQFGTTRSNVSVLRRAYLQDSSNPTVAEMTVKEGEPFHIGFQPLKSYPSAQYRWASADKIGASDSVSVDLVRSKRMQWADDGNLYFSYALPEDHLNGKIYKALTFNPSVDISAGGSYTRVTVKRSEGPIEQVKPTLSFSSPKTTYGLEGNNITLRCFFAAFPDPDIRWSGPNNVLPVGRMSRENFNTELRLMNLKQSDEGEYTCTGYNIKGSVSQKIKLIVQAVPVFNNSFPGPRNMNVTEGDSVTFSCNPYAKPKADVAWMINGAPLDVTKPPSRISVSSDGRSLIVRSVCRDCSDRESFSDLMVIQCNASNEYGYSYGAGYLNVLKRTTVTLTSESKVVIEDDGPSSVQFQCFPFSDPSTPVQILWYRVHDEDQRTLVYSAPPAVVVGNGTLVIAAGNLSDWAKHRGEYRCVAKNGYSADEKMVEIVVKIENVTMASTASILDLWWIFVIIACLFLILILILICCICIFRNRGDKYDVDGKERKNGNDPEKELVASGFHDYQRREIEPFKGSQNSLGSSARLFGDEDASEVGDHGKFLENGSYHSISYANTADRRKGRNEYI